MSIKVTFLGGVECVTGSCYLVEVDDYKLIVDCGLYQERECSSRNWAPFVVPVISINAVLLTHAHLDHCGLVPKMVKDGLNCPIYCTEATKEIAQVLLLDSAHLQTEDAAKKKKRHQRQNRIGPYPETPLYTVDDAYASFHYFADVKYGQTVILNSNIHVVFYNAGHVLGSASIIIHIRQGEVNRSILFSGDLGWWNKPILEDPDLLTNADYVIIESTYGGGKHQGIVKSVDTLADVINATVLTGGNIVIPSFALERTQDILFYLNKLLITKRIPSLMVFVDSPMAASVTDIFEKHTELLDEETRNLLMDGNSPFSFRGLKLVRTVEESKAINNIKGTCIILAGSGMCTGGRIKHHLVSNISRPESTILFVGYQARGTLGRLIVEGAREVRILGEIYKVRAKIMQIDGFSAHGDKDSLLQWLSGLKTPPRTLFVTHGENDQAAGFADSIAQLKGWPVKIPKYLDKVILD